MVCVFLFSALLSNSLRCTCQLKWLADLLQSDKDLPQFTGAFCKVDGDNNAHSLLNPNTPFDDCPGMKKNYRQYNY